MKVNRQTFEIEVVDESHQRPVLVSLWNPLEVESERTSFLLQLLEQDFAGGFKLVEIDVRDEPEVVRAFSATALPHVVLFRDGVPVTGFSGMASPDKVRSLLEREVRTPATRLSQRFSEALAEKRHREAADVGRALLAIDPADAPVRAGTALALLHLGRLDDAERTLALLPAAAAGAATADWKPLARMARQWLQAARGVEADAATAGIAGHADPAERAGDAAGQPDADSGADSGMGSSTGFSTDSGTDSVAGSSMDSGTGSGMDSGADTGVGSGTGSVTAAAALAAGDRAFIARDWPVALAHYLDVVRQDRTLGDDAGRQRMVAVFDLCGDRTLVARYRRQLGALLA